MSRAEMRTRETNFESTTVGPALNVGQKAIFTMLGWRPEISRFGFPILVICVDRTPV